MDVYKEFQAFFGADPLKLLSPAQTRRLSLKKCVNRLLEQYEALTDYFNLAANEDPSHFNDCILASLQNHFIQAYLQFLSFQLQRFNAFNRLFQSERPLLQNLKQEVERLIKSIASDFMKVSIVKTRTNSLFSVFPGGCLPCILVYKPEIDSDVFSGATFRRVNGPENSNEVLVWKAVKGSEDC